MQQVSHMSSSVLLTFCLLLITTDGTTMQKNVDDINVAIISPSTSLQLDDYNSTTSTDDSTINDNDVNGLKALITSFPKLAGSQFPEHSNDPCDPELRWILCSTTNDDTLRVTNLYLEFRNLQGTLPDFSSMDALETINLEQNSLNGSIPEFLGTFPDLSYLNLANNEFSGPIPDSVRNNYNIELNLTGNPNWCELNNSCTTPSNDKILPSSINPKLPPSNDQPLPSGCDDGDDGCSTGNPNANKPEKKSSKLPIILGSTITLVTIAWVLFAMQCRKRNKTNTLTANHTDVAESPEVAIKLSIDTHRTSS